MKPKIFVTRAFPGPGLDLLRQECHVDIFLGEDPPDFEIVVVRAAQKDGIVSMLTDRIDRYVMDAAGSSLKVVSNYAVGFDNIDIAEATSRGIPVGNTPGVLTEATADMTFALLMSAARRIKEGADFARLGKWTSWSPSLLLGCDVQGAVLGILGTGRIGKAVAKRAQGFDMEVIGCDSILQSDMESVGIKPVSFEELITRSDFLTIHVPLADNTRHIINGDIFKRMKNTAILINTARGPIIDHDALCDALLKGDIAYAALDVTDPEPLPADHRLYTLNNCLIVPHLGSATVSARSKMGIIAAQNLLAGIRGQTLPHCVNPEVYR